MEKQSTKKGGIMEFYGAEHYFFWRGIEQGQIAPHRTETSLKSDIVTFDMPISQRCTESYLWGYLWGLRLTSKEYDEMLNSPIIEVKLTKKKKSAKVKANNLPAVVDTFDDDFDKMFKQLKKDFPIKGNC